MDTIDRMFSTEKKEDSPPQTKTIYRTKEVEVIKSPFNLQELIDIENLIYNKISNYEINITRYKEKHNIVNDNDPRLKKAKNYREKKRYNKLLKKIEELKKGVDESE